MPRHWYLCIAEWRGRTYTTMVTSAHRALARIKLRQAAPSIPDCVWQIIDTGVV